MPRHPTDPTTALHGVERTLLMPNVLLKRISFIKGSVKYRLMSLIMWLSQPLRSM